MHGWCELARRWSIKYAAVAEPRGSWAAEPAFRPRRHWPRSRSGRYDRARHHPSSAAAGDQRDPDRRAAAEGALRRWRGGPHRDPARPADDRPGRGAEQSARCGGGQPVQLLPRPAHLHPGRRQPLELRGAWAQDPAGWRAPDASRRPEPAHQYRFCQHRSGRGLARRKLVPLWKRVRRSGSVFQRAGRRRAVRPAGAGAGRERRTGQRRLLQVAELDVGAFRQRERHALGLPVQDRRVPAAQRRRVPPAQRGDGLCRQRIDPRYRTAEPGRQPRRPEPRGAHARRVPGQSRLGRRQQHPPREPTRMPSSTSSPSGFATSMPAGTSTRPRCSGCSGTWPTRWPRLLQPASRRPAAPMWPSTARSAGRGSAATADWARPTRRRDSRPGSTSSACGTTGRTSSPTPGQPTTTVILDQREQVTEFGPFAQVNWNPSERWLVSAGARYDWARFALDDRVTVRRRRQRRPHHVGAERQPGAEPVGRRSVRAVHQRRRPPSRLRRPPSWPTSPMARAASTPTWGRSGR